MIWLESRTGTDSKGDRGGQVMTCAGDSEGKKKHINFFNISFLPPAQNPPFWAPRKIMCLISLGKNAKKGSTSTFSGGGFRVKNGVPTKCLVYCFFFLPLKSANLATKLTLGSHLPVPFWSGGALRAGTLNCTVCPHGVTSWGSPRRETYPLWVG